MSEIPAHQRLYADVIRALPLPGDPMTVDAYAKVHRLLLDDSDERAAKDSDPQTDNVAEATESAKEDEGPSLRSGGSHCADSSKSWSPTVLTPATFAFGFGPAGY